LNATPVLLGQGCALQLLFRYTCYNPVQIQYMKAPIPYASIKFFKLTTLCNVAVSKPEIEFLALSVPGNIKLGLRRMLVLLLDLDLNRSPSDLED
jgi:hypothetical protein